jgi:hypothetical protein
MKADAPGFTPLTLVVREQVARRPLHTFAFGNRSLAFIAAQDAAWIAIRREKAGGLAFRVMPPSAGAVTATGRKTKTGGRWRVHAPEGAFDVEARLIDERVCRITTSLTPQADLLIPFWPRDLYPLDGADDPTKAIGNVEASQRGLNTGLCYLRIARPAFGSVLYLQDLTSLNEYFEAIDSKPDGVVGGEWPELGYQPPSAPLGHSPPKKPLPAGKKIVISDAYIAIDDEGAEEETQSATAFNDLLAAIYPHLARPQTKFRDWRARATKTLRDLERANDVRLEHYGHVYLRPYLAAEYPDSMVQMAVAAPILDLARAEGVEQPFASGLVAGMRRFFDKELGVVRRYLPNVGDDKNKDAVDSWYLYHPLIALGRLALTGDGVARDLFEGSLDYAVKAARHFNYAWPIQYDVQTFKVITAARNDQGLGQTDVGGVYAYVMLLAHELTREAVYLREAKAALRALKEVRFELAYQTNLTAWGAAACMKLWALERDAEILAQSDVFIAGFLHNCSMWQSRIGRSRNFSNFLGATCLHDAAYMAAFECFEAFAAFDEYLAIGGDAVRPSRRLLLCEYRRYALDRAWFFYPDALPEGVIAKDDIRNGRIDRRLSFPLEDLYRDDQPAGKVGQEIYGCGGAFTFAARAFFACGDAPLRLFCDYPAAIAAEQGALKIQLAGPTGFTGRVRVLRKGKRELPRLSLHGAEGEVIPAKRRGKNFRDYELRADQAFTIHWS